MARRVVEVHWYEDDMWRGYLLAAPASELLRQHVWETYVAGVSHYESPDTWCEVGVPLELVPEPDNPYDPNAVSVWTQDGRQAGHIPRQTAADMDSSVDHRAVVLAEMRVDGSRVGLWVLVSRDLVDLKVTSALGSARDHVRRHVERMKELTLRSLEGPRKTVDPVEAMRMMADALPHDHLTVPG
jgi:hypothetical protein